MTKNRLAVVAAFAIVALFISIAWDYFNRDSVPHESIRLHLKLTAASVYEFHNATGRWPVTADDLAMTSLPQRSPYWKTLINTGSVAVVWRSDLRPDPEDNADVVVTYHNAGLFSKLGRVWVCWGDLRTEYVKEEALRAQLARRP